MTSNIPIFPGNLLHRRRSSFLSSFFIIFKVVQKKWKCVKPHFSPVAFNSSIHFIYRSLCPILRRTKLSFTCCIESRKMIRGNLLPFMSSRNNISIFVIPIRCFNCLPVSFHCPMVRLLCPNPRISFFI